MASKKSAGVAPLGHAPFSKIKLEGPKRHHDFHGNAASVPGKGEGMAVPNQAYEIHYNMHKPSENMVLVQGDDFMAKRPRDRKTTHLKVNETDS